MNRQTLATRHSEYGIDSVQSRLVIGLAEYLKATRINRVKHVLASASSVAP
jgi:hypothetical protein